MSVTPLISVLVITYNHVDYILKTLDSIVSQRGDFQLELVIANDCSTDSTDLVIQDFVSSHSQEVIFRYFNHPKNLGILPNLIFGLSQCSGNYIAFCEGDDYWLDEYKLQKQLSLYQQHTDCAMVITDRKVIREDWSSYDELYGISYRKTVFDISDVTEGFIPGLQTVFTGNNKQLIRYLKMHEDLTYADRYITYFFALEGKIYLLPEVTAVYKMTGSGAWSMNNGLRKLQLKAEHLEDFHRRIGLPLNNLTLARTQLNCWVATMKYCLKRPNQLKNSTNRHWIKATWSKFSHMNRFRILWHILFG
jgi:glycosyltransferase involved in cell wall biosynthesis